MSLGKQPIVSMRVSVQAVNKNFSSSAFFQLFEGRLEYARVIVLL